MRNRTAKIWISLVLLLTFVAGQAIVFAHSHQFDTQTTRHYTQKDKSTLSDDNCPICVQHGNVQLLLQQNTNFQFWAVSSNYTPVTYTPIYQSVKLLLSGNRGPPTA